MRKYGKHEKLYIRAWQLSKLLTIAIGEINSRNKDKKVKILEPRVMESLINDYFANIFKEVIQTDSAYIFQDKRLGKMQVLQVPSKKGYQWDKEFDGHDYELKFYNDLPLAKFVTDPSLYDEIIARVRSGMKYSDGENDTEENIDNLLQALNGRRVY